MWVVPINLPTPTIPVMAAIPMPALTAVQADIVGTVLLML